MRQDKFWGHNMTEQPITVGKASVSAGGTGFALVAQHLEKFTLADAAAFLTILYTGFMLYCAVVDRLEKRRERKNGKA